MDAHKNFAYSTVATAPSPASSGASLVVAAGEGAAFPAVPFNAVVCPVGTQPTNANAEVVRVTTRSTDTFTITRTQESTSARTVIVGDQIFAAVTAKTLADVEHYQAQIQGLGYYSETYPRMTISASNGLVSGSVYYGAVGLCAGDVVTNILANVGTTGSGSTGIGMKFGLYDKTGVKLAVTGDVSANAATTGARINALTGGTYTVTTTDVYYAAMLWIGGTPPAMGRATTATPQSLAVSGFVCPFGLLTGQTDLTTPVTIAASTNAFAFWFGVS